MATETLYLKTLNKKRAKSLYFKNFFGANFS